MKLKVPKFLKNSKKSPLKLALITLVIIFALLSITQAERLINKGTFFGYQIWNPEKSEMSKKNKAQSGSIKDVTKLPDGSNNEACKQITLDEVKSVEDKDFKQSGGLVPDDKKTQSSTCIYSFKGEGGSFEMVSVLIRTKDSKDSASKVIDSLKKGNNGEDIKGVGDKAYFNKSANQLTVVKDKQVATFTFSASDKSSDSKSVTLKIAKLW